MLGIKITVSDGVSHLSGQLDEHMDMKPLLAGAGPIVLNFAKIMTVNSIGIRKFIEFLSKAKGRPLEFHECPAAVVDMINSIPGTLGDPPDPAIVKSLYITYRCSRCDKEEEVLYAVKRVTGDLPVLPPRACPKCKVQTAPLLGAEDYFTYMLDC